MMQRVHTILLFVVLLLTPLLAHADVAPEQIRTKTVAGLEYHYPEGAEKAVDQLVEAAPDTIAKLDRELRLESLEGVQVWVLPEVDDYFEITGAPGRPPGWAVGLSLTDRSTVIVVNGTGPNGQLVDLVKTFRHELAHVAFDRRRKGRSVPRWFNEGFAILHAEEWTAERSDALTKAASVGNLKSFDDLTRTFPAHHNSASLAYDQSFHFVRWLGERHGEDIYADIFDQMGQGKDFEAAMKSATGRSLKLNEAIWKQELESASNFWAFLSDETVQFFGASLLFVVAWLITRYRRRKRLESMEDDVPADWDYDETRYPLPGEP
jgi:hypothetical protein